MPAPDVASGSLSEEVARSAGDIAEALDVMWKRAGESTASAIAPASPSQVRLMCAVDREEGIRMRTLCRRLAAAQPSVSRLCDRLQALGFVERLPSPENRREVTLRLTGAGETHLRHIREQRRRMLHHAIDAMPKADRRALARGLAGLRAQLTADSDEHRPGAVPAA